ncbi:MAG: peptidoglycan DD-metalloendopeptidase family protein [Actinomycetota bacterium]
MKVSPRKLPIVPLVLALVAGAMMATPAAAITEADLEAKRAQIAEAQDALDAATAAYSDAEARLAEIQDQLSETKATVDETRERLDGLEQQLGDHVRVAYVNGPGTTLSAIFTGGDFNEFSDRVFFLDRLAEADQGLVTRTADTRQELEWRQDDLAALTAEQEQALEDLEQQKQDVAAKIEQLNAELEDLEQRYREQLAAERAAERAAEKVAAQAAAEEETSGGGGGGGAPPPSGGSPFGACPVAGGNSFTDSWGDPRSGGRTHEGTDLLAAKGTPVAAAQSGSVAHGGDPLGGITATVTASNGDRTYYAHMNGYSNASGSVSAGTIIGYVGDTGNAAGTNHLHFGYYPGGGGAVNPYPYLLQVC